MFIWFVRWVRDKQSISQIAKESGYSERTLKTYFLKYYQRVPYGRYNAEKKLIY